MKKSKKILFGILYWIWQLTWGALMTIPGLLITGFCIVFLGGTPRKNGFSYIVEIGGNWGGLELGAVALCGNYYGTSYWDEIRFHEGGHNFQNLWWGPLMPFVIGIPSGCRYWYQRIMQSRGKIFPSGWYYKAWFESQANKLGQNIIPIIEK